MNWRTGWRPKDKGNSRSARQKKRGEKRRIMERRNAWLKYQDKKEIFEFCEGYRRFISACKTERECVTEMVQQAEKAGYRNIDEIIEQGTALKAGDKVYANNNIYTPAPQQ